MYSDKEPDTELPDREGVVSKLIGPKKAKENKDKKNKKENK